LVKSIFKPGFTNHHSLSQCYICNQNHNASMLQVNFIKANREEVLKGLAKKHFTESALVDTIISLDDERRKLQFEMDERQSKINSFSKEIGQLMAKGEKRLAEEKKLEVASLKSFLQPVSDQLNIIQNSLQENLIKLPNLPHASVPEGKTPEDNEIVREGGEKPILPIKSMAHWDLAKKYDLINFELGNKVTGAGFPFYKHKGAKLQRALIQYFLDYNTGAGYTEYEPPFMVNEASAYGTGQLPDKEGQMYVATADNLFLIPTAEVPLTNIYRDEILKEEDLPVKMTGYTPCFRREAGSYGKDVRGLNRVHQFDKVEVVQLVHPEKSYEVLEEMLLHVEKLLQSLQLPYRILRLCGGDMSFTSALTYDFEVYSAAQQKWLEVSSVSNFESFQTNRMKIRFKADGKIQLVHSLNGSSLALPRIVAALLENNQMEDGIRLPQVLWKYFGAENI
ncbi:MAG TPA: serine--tRNA ligase, partial [Hanamia sp.]|nr:serine--tRNA ligase [Hanamia sp.]